MSDAAPRAGAPARAHPFPFPQAHPHADPLPITPSLAPLLESARIAGAPGSLRGRSVVLALLALAVGVAAALVARALLALIALIGNLAFSGRLSWATAHPAHNALGAWVVAVPVVGALVVGLMARFGSPAIRGHGIPEAIEQILTNRSRIGARVLWLKPLSAAVSIGTGGPFGAEGPIIATGGALGSLLGQRIRVTADERKALLAAGAAAGMTATFGTPLAAVLLAIELLLFEFSAETLLPVLVACATAAVVRAGLLGFSPFFAMPQLAWPGVGALLACVPLGAAVGVAAVAITRAVYAVEDAFEQDVQFRLSFRRDLPSIGGPPGHEPLLVGCERADPGHHSVRGHQHRVGAEQRRDLRLVGLQLVVCPRQGRILPARRLQFDHPKRQPVDEDHHIRAPIGRALDHRELAGGEEIVGVRVLEIDQAQLIAANGAVLGVELDRDALDHQPVQAAVFFDQRGALGRQHLAQCVAARFGWDGGVQPVDCRGEALGKYHVCIGLAFGLFAVRTDFRVRRDGVAERPKAIEHQALDIRFGEIGHQVTSASWGAAAFASRHAFKTSL